jgi:DnaJ-related protein SCJ1
VRVTLEEIYNGSDFDVTYNRKVICPHCRGSGGDDPDDVKTCPKCGGTGQIITKKQLAPGFVQQFQQQCPHCGGEGKIITSTCHVCKGEKLTDSLDALIVWIERGVPDGHVMNYRDQADEYINVRSGSIEV